MLTVEHGAEHLGPVRRPVLGADWPELALPVAGVRRQTSSGRHALHTHVVHGAGVFARRGQPAQRLPALFGASGDATRRQAASPRKSMLDLVRGR